MKTPTLTKGLPELHIIKLVRRAHSAEQCQHRENCLTEKQMIGKLTSFITDLKHNAVQKEQERFNTFKTEILAMIESGSIKVGALGLSEDSYNFIRDFKI